MSSMKNQPMHLYILPSRYQRDADKKLIPHVDNYEQVVTDILKRLLTNRYKDNPDQNYLYIHEDDIYLSNVIDALQQEMPKIKVRKLPLQYKKYGKRAYIRRINQGILVSSIILLIHPGECDYNQQYVLDQTDSINKITLTVDLHRRISTQVNNQTLSEHRVCKPEN